MWWRISACLVLSSCLMTGCNKDEDNATGPLAPVQPSEIAKGHPTTQQLLTGPRSALDVKYAPIKLQVPMGWELKTHDAVSVVTIEGKTPTDIVGIAVSGNRAITVDQQASLESHAKQDFVDHPDLLKKPGVRDIAGGKVIERLIVDPIRSATQPTGGGEPIQTLQWTFTLCIPGADGKTVDAYDLRFLGMTLKQYKTDQAFLRSVIDSMSYTPSTDTLAK